MTNETKTTAFKQTEPSPVKAMDEDSATTHITDLPDGVTAVNTVQYKVGPYTYSNLDDALAEHRRQSSKRSKIE